MKRVIISGILLLALFCPSFGQNEAIVDSFCISCAKLGNEFELLKKQCSIVPNIIFDKILESEGSVSMAENAKTKYLELFDYSIETLNGISILTNAEKEVKQLYYDTFESESSVIKTIESASVKDNKILIDKNIVTIVDSIHEIVTRDRETIGSMNIEQTDADIEMNMENESSEDSLGNSNVILVVLCIIVGLLFAISVILFWYVHGLKTESEGIISDVKDLKKQDINTLEKKLTKKLNDGLNSCSKNVATNSSNTDIRDLNSQIDNIKSELKAIKKSLADNAPEYSRPQQHSKSEIEGYIADSTKQNIQSSKCVNVPTGVNSRKNDTKSTPKPQKSYYKLYGNADGSGQKKLYKVTEKAENLDLFVVLLDSPESTTGMFTLRDDCSLDLQKSAIANRGKKIDPVCYVFEAEANARYIKVEEEGKVHKENGEWIVDEQMFVTLKA